MFSYIHKQLFTIICLRIKDIYYIIIYYIISFCPSSVIYEFHHSLNYLLQSPYFLVQLILQENQFFMCCCNTPLNDSINDRTLNKLVFKIPAALPRGRTQSECGKRRSLNITDKVPRLLLPARRFQVRKVERRKRGMDGRGEIVGIAGLEIVKRNAKEALIGFFREIPSNYLNRTAKYSTYPRNSPELCGKYSKRKRGSELFCVLYATRRSADQGKATVTLRGNLERIETKLLRRERRLYSK